VRSPGYRHLQQRVIQAGQRRFGFPENYKFDPNLLSLTINQHFPMLASTLESGGKVVLLHSWRREFVTGEGYLNNLNGSTHQSSYRCLVPLTPQLCALLFRDLQYLTESNCFSVALTEKEALTINCITQLYTKDSILFRSQQPLVEEFFAERSFRALFNHSHELIEALCKAARR
jgi:hypothetical protein